MYFELNNYASADPFADQHLELQFNTSLEMLTFANCTCITLERNTLAMLGQVSSNRFRLLNISVGVVAEALDRHRSRFAAVDTILQNANFSNLEALTIGLPKVDPEYLNLIEDYFPRTTARGLVSVMDGFDMARQVRQGRGACE